MVVKPHMDHNCWFSTNNIHDFFLPNNSCGDKAWFSYFADGRWSIVFSWRRHNILHAKDHRQFHRRHMITRINSKWIFTEHDSFVPNTFLLRACKTNKVLSCKMNTGCPQNRDVWKLFYCYNFNTWALYESPKTSTCIIIKVDWQERKERFNNNQVNFCSVIFWGHPVFTKSKSDHYTWLLGMRATTIQFLPSWDRNSTVFGIQLIVLTNMVLFQ